MPKTSRTPSPPLPSLLPTLALLEAWILCISSTGEIYKSGTVFAAHIGAVKMARLFIPAYIIVLNLDGSALESVNVLRKSNSIIVLSS